MTTIIVSEVSAPYVSTRTSGCGVPDGTRQATTADSLIATVTYPLRRPRLPQKLDFGESIDARDFFLL